MIAVDTSSLIAFFSEEHGRDALLIDDALAQRCLVFPPTVLCEMLSDHRLSAEVIMVLKQIPLLTVSTGYWERAGLTRAKLLRKGLKARLADTLIAQSCIDHDVPLIARDADYRHFAKLGGLKLL